MCDSVCKCCSSIRKTYCYFIAATQVLLDSFGSYYRLLLHFTQRHYLCGVYVCSSHSRSRAFAFTVYISSVCATCIVEQTSPPKGGIPPTYYAVIICCATYAYADKYLVLFLVYFRIFCSKLSGNKSKDEGDTSMAWIRSSATSAIIAFV